MPVGYAPYDNGVWYHSLDKTKAKTVFPAISAVTVDTPILARLLLYFVWYSVHFDHCKTGEVS
jgi:hypothetical protein